MSVPLLLSVYPLVDTGVCPHFGCCEPCCCKHGGGHFSQTLLSVSVSPCPDMWLLGHMVVLFLIFWETSILFSTWTIIFYSPTNRSWRLQFLYILANNCYFLIFVLDNNRPNGYIVVSHFGHFHFPNEHLFMCYSQCILKLMKIIKIKWTKKYSV